MRDWYDKLSKTKKLWIKRTVAAILCVVVVFATMPSTVSNAAYYHARILRTQHLTGDDDMLQNIATIEDEKVANAEEPQQDADDADDTDNAENKEADDSPVDEDTPADEENQDADSDEKEENKEEEEAAPVEVKIAVQGLDDDVSCTITLKDADGNEVSKTADDTYSLTDGNEYDLEISEIEGFTFVSVNGSSSKHFTYYGEDTITIVFEKNETDTPVMTEDNGMAAITVSGISNVISITFTAGDKAISATSKGNGTYEAALEKGTEYTVTYDSVQGYYPSVNIGDVPIGTDIKTGNPFTFTYNGEKIDFIFNSIPKIYTQSNGDISFVSENAYSLKNEYGITDFSNYQDGSAFTLKSSSGNFMTNFPYFIVNSTDVIQINVSEAYQMVVTYVANGNSTVNLSVDGNAVGNATSGIYNTQTYDVLLAAGTHTIGGSADIGIETITLYKMEEKTYTINLQGGMTPADTELEFVSADYQVTSTAKVTDGKLQVKLKATTYGITYEVTKIAGTGLDFIENKNEVTVKRDTDEIDSFEVESSGTVELTLAAEDTDGKTFDANKVTAVNVIYNRTKTSYTKDTTGKYQANLIIGNKYSFSAEGISDYQVDHINVTIDGTKTENMTMPYKFLGTETEIEMVFAPKKEVKVYFDLTAEDKAMLEQNAISMTDLKFTFTPIDGNGTTYTDVVPKQEDDKYYVDLITGTYDVVMSAEEKDNKTKETILDKIPYELSSKTLKVEEEGDVFYIDLTKVETWYFYNDGAHTYYQGEINKTTGYYKGIHVDASGGGKLDYRESNNDTQLNANTFLSIPVDGACTLTVKCTNNAGANAIAADTANTNTNINVSGEDSKINYTGESGVVRIYNNSEKSIYLKSISIEYAEQEVPPKPDDGKGPFIAEDDKDIGTANPDTDGNPRRSKKETVNVDYTGQVLTVSQTNGKSDDLVSSYYNSDVQVGYYVFQKSTDFNTLTFDMKISSLANNKGGVFVGAFSDNYLYTCGFRGNQRIQNVCSQDELAEGNKYASNSTKGESTYELNEKFQVTITRTSDTAFTITATSYTDKAKTVTYDYKVKDTTEKEYYYGFLLNNVTVQISNLLLTKPEADGSVTTVYNQNDYYYPAGSCPTARALYATSTEENGKSVIKLSVMGDTPSGDGFYVLQRAEQSESNETIDESAWTTIEEALYGTEFTDDSISARASINYVYRVRGQLGRESLGGAASAWVTSKSVDFEGSLAQPEVTVTTTQTGITLTWEAVTGADYYTIYRFAYGDDQEAEEKYMIKRKETGLTYTDSVSSKSDSIKQDDPYYYYVKAVAQDNESLFSEDAVVWGVAASNRSGYDYESCQIFITNRSYETVFDSEITIEGLVNGSGGTIDLYVNGSKKDSRTVADREAFSFVTNVQQGRNDVYLLFTGNNGTQTKKAFNYVYATDFDVIVDASFKGTDGSASTIVSGATIPTYKTITEALKHADGSRYVVLVLEGEYDERLVVTKPNITLLGEDMEKTVIHNNPGNVGGDTSLRCATYIQSAATDFHAENLTFKNDYAYTGASGNESADAVRCDADGAQFIHCTFDGMQDTLYVNQGQQYYEKCNINGIVDYIYCDAGAKAFFNECMLTFQAGSAKTSGYVVAPRTAETNNFGMVFYKCGVLAESGCNNGAYYLARPWGAGGMAVWIQCFMGKSIKAATPYAAMSNVSAEEGRFYEWYSYGSGYAINTERPQISATKAAEFVNDGKKSYHHDYKGDLKTTREKKYTSAEFVSDEYSWSDGDDSAMADYFMEGYGVDYGVSGGGLLKETSSNYYAVGSAEEFLQALTDIKAKKSPAVVELTADICLGSKEVDTNKYSNIIKPYAAQPLTHPTLMQTGVSVLTIDKMSNLTIFSSNASSIKHANVDIKASSNIMIRNIVFDELWEWDEDTAGDYDRNDWDYMTIEKSDGVWIDHCTFYKAYDGVIDIKSPNPTERVTISWCQFRPGSEGDTFFNAMLDYLKANPDKFPKTYQQMISAGMTDEQIKMYAYGQKKTHLFGQDDSASDAKGLRITLANNYYYDSMDRMPRLRYGISHMYNCIMDSQGLLTARKTITDSHMRSKIVSNGASSTCGGQILLEDCYISGIENALNSGNGSSPAGYINAINSVYYMDGTRATLEVKNNTKADDQVLITDAASFRKNLGYDYSLKNAINLFSTMLPHSGAGSVTMTTLQWEKTDYNVAKKASETSSVSDAPTSSEDIPDRKDYDEDIKNETPDPIIPEKKEPEQTLEVNEKIQEIVDSMEEEKKETDKKEEKEATAVPETKKPGDVVMVNGKAYTVADAGGTIAYRVAYAIPDSVLTAAVKSATGAGSINDLIAYLKNDIVSSTNSKLSQLQARDISNTAVYDLSIVILQANGEWAEVTKDNFPSAGLDVLIPYPSGTSASTHRFGVSHLIVLGCNGKTPGAIEYLTPSTQDNGLQVHVTGASPFTVVYEAISGTVQAAKQEEESAGSKWVTAQNAISSASEEDDPSRARNGDMSTRQTLDSVMGSGYLVWVTFISIAIMSVFNYQYYRYKKKQEEDTGIIYGESMSIL